MDMRVMSIQDLELLLAKDTISLVEKSLYERTHNSYFDIAMRLKIDHYMRYPQLDCPPDWIAIIELAEKIVERYNLLIKNQKAPFYLKYFVNYLILKELEELHPDYDNTNKMTYLVSWISSIVCTEFLNTINETNFDEVYRLLYDEGIAIINPEYLRWNQIWCPEDFYYPKLDQRTLSIFAIDFHIVQQGIGAFKECYDCVSLYTLYETQSIHNCNEMIDRLLSFCNNVNTYKQTKY